MTNQIVRKLDFSRKLALSIVGTTVLLLPIILGLVRVVESNAASGYTSSESEMGASGAISSQNQSQMKPKLSFDTVSIKRAADCKDRDGSWPWPLYRAGGSYSDCGGLVWLIRQAYNLKMYNRLEGGPEWSKKISYRIEAKAEGNPNKEQMQRMIQSMLEDRFKLKMHTEKHESTVYSLVIAKGGHKLQLAKDKYGNPITSELSLEEINKPSEKSHPPRKFKSGEDLIANMPPGSTIAGGNLNELSFLGKALKMSYFADLLSFHAGNLPIIDKTGLTGLYDIHLKFAPQNLIRAASPALSEEPSAPSIFKALQEQLGLRLEPKKGAIDYYIIDSVEKPSEN